jgi:hypothetical protein
MQRAFLAGMSLQLVAGYRVVRVLAWCLHADDNEQREPWGTVSP